MTSKFRRDMRMYSPCLPNILGWTALLAFCSSSQDIGFLSIPKPSLAMSAAVGLSVGKLWLTFEYFTTRRCPLFSQGILQSVFTRSGCWEVYWHMHPKYHLSVVNLYSLILKRQSNNCWLVWQIWHIDILYQHSCFYPSWLAEIIRTK